MVEDVIKVEQVRVELVRRLRETVLRPDSPPELSIYPSDSSPDAQHFAAWFENKIVGAASIYPESLPANCGEFENPWRLRGMAVVLEQQGKGIGKAILREAINFIKRLDGKVLWCNGRTTALGFYRSFGFEIIGEEFDVPESGAHFVMILRIEG
jgi:GNAT superfamily N-acetyltransferase